MSNYRKKTKNIIKMLKLPKNQENRQKYQKTVKIKPGINRQKY